MRINKRLFLCMLLALVGSKLRAQEFTILDWNVLRIDSILPVYTEVVPLESDYRLYDYRVSLEYPEWADLTASEQKAMQNFAGQVGEEVNVESRVGVSRRQGMLDISFVPLVCRGGKYQKLLSAKVAITSIPKSSSISGSSRISGLTRSTSAERFTRESKLSKGKWVKISIKEDGIYRLTPSTLRKMGFSNPDKVHLYGYGGHRLSEVMDPDNMYDDLEEVPLYQEKGRGTKYFWGNGLLYWEGEKRIFNPYATKAYYFLTEEEESNKIDTLSEVKGSVKQVYNTFTDHVLYEKDEYSWFQGGRNLYDGNNFGKSGARRASYKLQSVVSRGNERLTVVLGGFNASVTPTVNNKPLSALTLGSEADFVYARIATRTFDVSDCKTADNQWNITLQSNKESDVRLDYLALHYDCPIVTNDYVVFSQTGNGVSRFDLMVTDAFRVMRLSEPGMPAAMVPTQKREDGMISITVDDPTHRYVAFAPYYEFPEPQFEGTVENQNLHALDSLDMVIIIPANGKLQGQAERLAEAHRAYDGLRVGVVRADQIYNEFSSGTPDATAYRMLMKMLYDRAATANDGSETKGYEGPKYLLLMGACLWDNRMLTMATRNCNPDDYLLCFESENSWSDTESYVMEEYFGLLDDGEGATLTRDKTDLGVGRFPVRTVDEARVMVDKTIAYLSNSNAGSWKNIVMMLGDDGDSNSHMKYCNDVAESIISNNPELEVRKVMWDAYTRESSITSNTYPEVTELITKQVNDGAMMINYTGHAAPYSMSHEWVLRLKDFQQFKGKNPPLWFTAACDVMPFDQQTENLGVTAVLNPSGAALAFVGTARTVYASNNRSLNLYFSEYLFGTDADGKRYRLGDALRLSKVSLVGKESFHLENKLQYALLGDPALVIGAPMNRVNLETICDARSGEKLTQIKAGQAVRMEGVIVNSKGEEMKDFNGIVTGRVYDSMDTIVCNLNDPQIKEAFEFTNRSQVLFSGRDSVRMGRFSLSFVVPQDIKFTNGSGRVVFYAVNDSLSQEANGYNEDFTVGGIALSEDGSGPEIELALNGEYGGVVNCTPYLTARLHDPNGINVSGTGIGHDLVLCVDGDASQTYVLNDSYIPDFGDYTSGTIAFTIPNLEAGKHTLTLRAWDLLNNTSSKSLDFEVDMSYKPTIIRLAASPAIAKESTTFLLSYDLPGTESEYEIEVFDFAGRRLWHFAGEGSSNGTYAIPWNLSVGDNRGRISPGVYLYRATLKCGDSKKVTESQKLIVR